FPDAADGQRAAGQEPDPAADRRPEGQPVSQDQEQAPAGSNAGGTETVAEERGSSREDQGQPEGEVAAQPAKVPRRRFDLITITDDTVRWIAEGWNRLREWVNNLSDADYDYLARNYGPQSGRRREGTYFF